MNQKVLKLFGIAGIIGVCFAVNSARASTITEELPAGYSDQSFQITGSSRFSININSLGQRDPSICASCSSGYSDNFTVNFFDSAGNRVGANSGTNYLYSTQYSSSHGIGAAPIWLTVPSNATTIEVISQLSIFGLTGTDTGNLNIFTDGSIAAATPLPGALILFATGLAAIGLWRWRRTQGRAALNFFAPAAMTWTS